ncbi:MAG TPA: BamA/TamA family outer membrane protein [Gemmatimonadales bacterium]|nr:BamA/TamA family outer membrane protein [Gemmatimonadales bacterium]
MYRKLALLLAFSTALPAVASAQYFGQNKVQYKTFDFQIIQTEHFDVYFYPREREAAMDAARMAERSYARLSRVLNHEFHERKPIILYASHSDFQQTNATSGEVSEGTGGFTDFLKHRNILPFTGDYSEFEHVMTHEMVHQFQYDTWARGRAGAGIQTIIAVNPPLWFVEGMAEYLSKGGIDANTAMWLRDAALEGTLPTIDQMENDPRIFPYRYGEALMAYIGERWGDEAIGAILQGSLSGSLEGSFRRVLGLGFDELSNQWRDAVQKRYLPEIGNRVRASAFAKPVLTRKLSDGTLHLAPALSPDGSQIAYFSEKDFYFVDLYLADANTGRVKRRILKSSFSPNYETFRFINSGVAWSPDGRYLALTAKKGPKDDLVIVDVARHHEVKRISIDLNGMTTPAWSPDGKQLVFTGYDGGISDLYVVNADGTGFRKLTNDRNADLHPVWSPDGKTIAFATDRGPATDFQALTFSNMRIALYHLDDGSIEMLDHMEAGRNSSPQFSPDGKTIAFVSDRNLVSNIYLYDLTDRSLYQLTNLFTGVQGITPLSPAISWARNADRLAFVYYENEMYDVYSVDNPRALRKPYNEQLQQGNQQIALIGNHPAEVHPDSQVAQPTSGAVREGGSIYRTENGFRESGQARADSTVPPPVSIAQLLDSVRMALPDTSEFTIKKARTRFTPDYVARPTVGYSRDTFGRGFFGGTAISLSDMLGDHTLLFTGYVNGSLAESQIEAVYINLAHRINWAVGAGQEPYFYREATEIRQATTGTEDTLVTNVRRLILRSAFAEGYYPLNRFRRIEAGLRVANVSDDRLSLVEPFDGLTGLRTADPKIRTQDLGSSNYVQPSLALVFDNSLNGYVGPFFGKRYRLSLAQSVGTWTFTTATADYRRYDKLVGPIVLATRGLYFGRIGRDADQFQVYLGSTDLIRGNTSGSYFRNECKNSQDLGTLTGCGALDRLIGTQIAVFNAEVRFPVLNSQLFHWLPLGFPPVEGALFYDAGVAWNENSRVRLDGDTHGDPLKNRIPLQSFGASLRTNLFNFVILRLDYARPIRRPGVGGLWTISLGPTF